MKEYSLLALSILSVKEGNAEVFYTDIDPDIELQYNDETAGIDMDDNGTIDFKLLKESGSYTYVSTFTVMWRFREAIWAGVYATFENGIAGLYAQSTEADPIGYYPYALESGVLINDELSFQHAGYQLMALGFYTLSGDWHDQGVFWNPDIEDHYLGVEFLDEENCHHYGWIRCSVTDSAKVLTLKDYAFEGSCNHPIVAGDTISYTAIENQSQLITSIYSFNKTVYVTIPAINSNTEICIYELSGNELLQKEIRCEFSEIQMEGFPTGIYIAIVKYNGKSYSRKVYIN